jgi:phage/plasmid-like protein (TIGR03299 family)
MSHEIETIAYTNETPWHGLGVRVSDDLTPEEMLIAAGLDWTVSKRPLYFPKANTERTELKIVKDQYALVRDSDQKMLDLVGSNFKPVQNAEAFTFFDRFVRSGGMTMETAGSLRGGQYIWALAKIHESFNVNANDEDRIEGYLLLTQPHRFGFSMVAALTPVRVVCMNTMRAALGGGLKGRKGQPVFRMPHSRAFDEEVQQAAIQALGLAKKGMERLSEVATTLATVRISEADLARYFQSVVYVNNNEDEEEQNQEPEEQSRTIKKLLEISQSAPGQQIRTAQGTLWGAYNSITYWTDHITGRNDDNRLSSAWYGQGQNLKQRALTKAVELAKAA